MSGISFVESATGTLAVFCEFICWNIRTAIAERAVAATGELVISIEIACFELRRVMTRCDISVACAPAKAGVLDEYPSNAKTTHARHARRDAALQGFHKPIVAA